MVKQRGRSSRMKEHLSKGRDGEAKRKGKQKEGKFKQRQRG